MKKRKTLQFQGKNKEALAVQRQAEELIKAGKVSDEEMIRAAYI